MKVNKGIAIFICILSVISGYLMSKASLVGRAGMSLFYRQYNFLKTWWKGGMLILVTLSSLYYLHWFIQEKTGLKQARKLHRIACFLALTGLYLTYNDFRHTLSHRLLGERFHLGVYLFWIGWMVISLYFAFNTASTETEERVTRHSTGNTLMD